MTRVADVRARALRSLIPPPRLRLAAWIKREIVLPEGVSALPGHVRLWPYQREIADAISDPLIERVTLVKGVRLGFTEVNRMRQQCRQEHRASEHELLQRIKVLWAADIALAKAQAAEVDQK
jgi:Phage terminase large subunit (GpA)